MGHDAVDKNCVVRPAEVDMTQHVVIWLDGMLRNTAVAAVCSPLDVMLSRAVGGRRRQYTLHVVTLPVCDAVITCSVSLNLLALKDHKWPYHFGHALTYFLKELAWWAFDGDMRWMRWWRLRGCYTHWENTHLPRLCCGPLDLLKGHAMSYDEGSVSIANIIIMYMPWRSCCLHHPGMWLACLSFSSPSVAISVSSIRDLLLMQIQRISFFTLAFSRVEHEVLTPMWRDILEKTKYNDAFSSSSGLLEARDQCCSSTASDSLVL